MWTILAFLREFIRRRGMLPNPFALAHLALGFKWRKGKLVCPHPPDYEVRISHYVRGELKDVLVIRTCRDCDPGA